MSIPSLPLWMALGAALPLNWGVVQVYFAITVVLSVLGWTGLARTVRSNEQLVGVAMDEQSQRALTVLDAQIFAPE